MIGLPSEVIVFVGVPVAFVVIVPVVSINGILPFPNGILSGAL